MRIQFTASLAVALIAGCAFAQDWNVSVKTDTNGVLRVPLAAPFAASNNLATVTAVNASNAVQDTALGATSTADRVYADLVSSNAAVVSSNYTDTVSSNIYVSMTATSAADRVYAESLTNGVVFTNDALYSAILSNCIAGGADVVISNHTLYITIHSNFDYTAISNAPWILPSELGATSTADRAYASAMVTATSAADRVYAAGLTNGYASTGYVQSAITAGTQGLVTASITNGLGGGGMAAIWTNTLVTTDSLPVENTNLWDASSDYQYTTNDGTYVTVTNYVGANVNLYVPGVISGITVKVIGNQMFNNNDLVKSIVFPDSATNFGSQVFYSANSLTNIVIGSNTTYLGFGIFNNMGYLKSIYFRGSVPEISAYNGINAFSACFSGGEPATIIFYRSNTTGWDTFTANNGSSDLVKTVWTNLIATGYAPALTTSNWLGTNFTPTITVPGVVTVETDGTVRVSRPYLAGTNTAEAVAADLAAHESSATAHAALFAAVSDDTSWRGSTQTWNSVTGKADVVGRLPTTNYAVSVSGGTWDGVSAVLSGTGDVSLLTTSAQGISDFGYSANGTSYDVTPEYMSPTGWATLTGGRLYVAGVTNVRLRVTEPNIPPVDIVPAVLSNLVLHVWGDNARVGRTNDFGGLIIKVDSAAGTYEPVPLGQMQTAIASAVADVQPSRWASYPALSVVDCAGQDIKLDANYRIGIVSNMFSITYQGNNILTVAGGGVSEPAIKSFAVDGGTGTVVVLGMAGWKPVVEWTGSLVTPAWGPATVISETYPTLSAGTFSVVFETVTNSPAYYRVVATNLSGSALSVAFSAPVSAPGFSGSGAGLTGITSNSIDAATDAAYRAGGGDGVSGGDVTNITTALIKPYTNHQDRVDNPHGTTPAQIGAITNTPAGIAAAGGLTTNLYWLSASNLLGTIVDQTCNIPRNASAPSWDQQYQLAMTQETTVAFPLANWPTGRAYAVALSLQTQGFQLTLDGLSISNQATIVTNKENLLIWSKAANHTNGLLRGAGW